MDHMRRGEFEAAWAISDAALNARAGVPCWHLPRHLQYVWDGTPLAGRRIMVRCYHGLGDTIQFIRYIPLVKALASEVSVWVQPKLLPLLRTMHGIDWLLPLDDGMPDMAYDVDVEVMELPHVLRTTLATIPDEIPYLQVEPVPLPRQGRLAVGLTWRAGEWDARRSVPFALLAPLKEVFGITWYVLQHGPGLTEWRPGFGILPLTKNLYEEARLMRALDLVISGASRGRTRRARLDATSGGCRLALDGESRRQPLVPNHAAVPPSAAGGLGTGDYARRCGIGAAKRRHKRRQGVTHV